MRRNWKKSCKWKRYPSTKRSCKSKTPSVSSFQMLKKALNHSILLMLSNTSSNITPIRCLVSKRALENANSSWPCSTKRCTISRLIRADLKVSGQTLEISLMETRVNQSNSKQFLTIILTREVKTLWKGKSRASRKIPSECNQLQAEMSRQSSPVSRQEPWPTD